MTANTTAANMALRNGRATRYERYSEKTASASKNHVFAGCRTHNSNARAVRGKQMTRAYRADMHDRVASKTALISSPDRLWALAANTAVSRDIKCSSCYAANFGAGSARVSRMVT
jgi:hypothetical protein